MEAVRGLIPLVLLIVSCSAEFNSTKTEGKKIEPVILIKIGRPPFKRPLPNIEKHLISTVGPNAQNIYSYAFDGILNYH